MYCGSLSLYLAATTLCKFFLLFHLCIAIDGSCLTRNRIELTS